MKRYIILLLLFSFTITSCNKTEESTTLNNYKKIELEIAQLKKDNELLKKQILDIKNTKIVDTWITLTNSWLNSKDNLSNTWLTNVVVSQDDINLAWCKDIKQVWNIKWCMKNSELVKSVENYWTNFSNSIQNDSWIKWIYESEKSDKLYTFEYLEKACWLFGDEWLITDNKVYNSCPCPNWYHVPTSKDWTDTSDFYKNNTELIKSELNIKNCSKRLSQWFFDNNSLYGNRNNCKFHSSSFDSSLNNSRISYLSGLMGESINDAHSVRCVKNN